MTKRTSIRRGSIGRGLAVSVAGLRAGSAVALGTAIGRIRGNGVSDELLHREARRFTAELGKLKGSYVKIGQMLALMGEHFLPQPLTAALHELESQTHPIPFRELEPGLRRSLGDRLDELEVDPKPLAAASLAQVHRARIRTSGREIVLKIQYPDLAGVIDDDFDAVVRMLVLARWLKAGRELDEWLEDMRSQLHNEVNYLRELKMTQAARERLLENDPRFTAFYVPECFERYSSAEVLAFEYVDGARVTQPEVGQLSQRRRNALGAAMLELFFFELFEWGVLQTDPNFGNYLLRRRKNEDQIVLLDFGSTIEIDERFQHDFASAIVAGQNNQHELLIKSLEGLGCLREDSSDFARDSFAEFCRLLLEPLRPREELPSEYTNSAGKYCWGKSRLMQRVGKHVAGSAATRHFTTPSRDFAFIVRKLTGVFTFISVLNAEFNGFDIATRYIEAYVSPENLQGSK